MLINYIWPYSNEGGGTGPSQATSSAGPRNPSGHPNSGAVAKRHFEQPNCSSARPQLRPKWGGIPSDNVESGEIVKREQAIKMICTYFLKGKCSYDGNCVKIHPEGKKPFVWRYRMISGSEESWEQFDPNTNVQLETAFCDPSQSTCRIRFRNTDLLVDLRTKEMKGLKNTFNVERLVTLGANSGWKWYMQYPENASSWKDFSGPLLDTGVETSVHSDYLEKSYNRFKNQKMPKFNIEFSLKDGLSKQLELKLEISTKYDAPEMTAVTTGGNEGIRRFKVERRPTNHHLVPGGGIVQKICDYHPIKPCQSPKCPMQGYHVADTLWVYKESRETRWKHFKMDLGKQLERDFSQPSVTSTKVDIDENLCLELALNDKSDFDSVTVVPGNYEVRRIAYNHPESTALTSYTWFWEADICRERYAQLLSRADEGNNVEAHRKLLSHIYEGYAWWIEFGGINGMESGAGSSSSSSARPSVSPQSVEELFQLLCKHERDNPTSASKADEEKTRLGLDFEQMVQTVSDSNGNSVQRRLRRRLNFGSQQQREAEREIPG